MAKDPERADPFDEHAREAWNDEILRRIHELNEGRAVLYDAESVDAEAEQI